VVEGAKEKKTKKAARAEKITAAGLDAEESDLLAVLKAERAALAHELNAPAYVVFADRTLIEMARAQPRTRDEMAEIHGVGAAKLARFGDVFLQAIARHARG